MVQFPRDIKARIREREVLMIPGASGKGCKTQLPRDKILGIVQKYCLFAGVKTGR